MANGRRGSRGRGRGKSVAQSGGIANSFSDGKKGAGSTWTRGGGSNIDRATGGTTRKGDKVTYRTPGPMTSATGSVKRGAPSELSGSPKPRVSAPKRAVPNLRKGQVRQAGGSSS